MSPAADDVLAGLFTESGLDDPYPAYAGLHGLGPASLLTGSGSYAVVVNGYEAADQVLRDPRFRVVDSGYVAPDFGEWAQHPTLATLYSSMMFSNAPAHTRMRRLFHQVFTPRRVAGLEPVIVELVDGLMDRLEAKAGTDGRADFMAEFAYLLPSSVVGTLLGIPQQDLGWFRPRVERINDFLDVTGKTPQVLAAADRATVELTDYYADLLADRRARPRDDLVSSLVQELDAGGYETSPVELVSNLLVLFNASFVTTIHLLGNGMHLLLSRPDLAAALRDDPALAAGYVEEMLRYDTSVQFVVRFTDEEVWVAGLPMPRHRLVLVVLGAANRDPDRFDRPDRFDPLRPDNRPLSFGAGAHFCLGAALARSEARLAFPLLLKRFPGLVTAAEPVRNRQQFLRGYSSLPVAL